MLEIQPNGIITKMTPQADGTVIIDRYQDSEPVIKHVHAMNAKTPSKGLRYLGSVPNVLLEKWMMEVGHVAWRKMSGRERTAYIIGKLRDPDYKKLTVGAI